MARYAGGKTKREKTADKRHRRTANREAKENIKWVLIVIASLVILISALVWMSSRKADLKKADPKKANFKKADPKKPDPKKGAPEKADSKEADLDQEELVKMFKEKIEEAMTQEGITESLEELMKNDEFKQEFRKAVKEESIKMSAGETKT